MNMAPVLFFSVRFGRKRKLKAIMMNYKIIIIIIIIIKMNKNSLKDVFLTSVTKR